MYHPDNWVILKIEGPTPHYKVLAGWSGGYTQGSSWRMNSGITRHEFKDNYWYFYGASSSCYKCHEDMYGLRINNAYVYNSLKEQHGDRVSLLEDTSGITEDFDWGL